MYVDEPNPIPEALPQKPKPESKFTDPFWYANQPLGVNTLSKMIKEHSLGSTLSKTYTNHRVRFRLPYAMNCIAVVNLYLTRVIPSEYLKVYLLSIGALRSPKEPLAWNFMFDGTPSSAKTFFTVST